MQKGTAMKQSLWILNSALAILLVFALVFIFISRPSIAKREPMQPAVEMDKKKEIVVEKPDTEAIYENDLFGTYHKEVVAPVPTPTIDQMPQAPSPPQVQIPPIAEPQFLQPLPITLTGIIIADDNNSNMALILDANTQEEVGYRVGDKIGDAQLIRIFARKVIIIRSNGQQESLYLTQEDAEDDAPTALHGYWDGIIEPISQGVYMIDPREFIKKVKNIGQLIETLDLTTAYQEGKSIGVRIGMLDENSFAYLLGLETGDIIESIDDIPAVNTENNVKIYEHISSAALSDTITIVINRAGEKSKTIIKLGDIIPEPDTPENEKLNKEQEDTPKKDSRMIEQEKIELLRQKYRFAPTMQEIKKKESSAMWQQGKRGALSHRLKTHNRLSR